jgi:hypothetical protein
MVAHRLFETHSFRADRLHHILARHSKSSPRAAIRILQPRECGIQHHVTAHSSGFEPWELHTTTPTQARFCRAALRVMHNLDALRSSDKTWGCMSVTGRCAVSCLRRKQTPLPSAASEHAKSRVAGLGFLGGWSCATQVLFELVRNRINNTM